MLPLAPHSRRALVAATALVAVAPQVAVAKKKKPLAFVAARLTAIFTADGGANFVWQHHAQLSHPDSGFADAILANTTRSVQSSESQVRAAIAATLKQTASLALNNAGHDVPENRIAVVLL